VTTPRFPRCRITDPEALRAVTPDAVRAYLRAHGWLAAHAADAPFERWVAPGDSDIATWRHVLLEPDAPPPRPLAWPEWALNALGSIATVEERSEILVWQDITVATPPELRR
jgi:hypothetical protein